MRIAVISTLVDGGATIAAQRITQALSKAGHECTFFVLEEGANPHFRSLSEASEGACGSNFWMSSAFSRWLALTPPEALKEGAQLFSDTFVAAYPFPPLPTAIHNAEVIHLHWMAGMFFSPALLLAMQGKKIVWTLHDMNAFTGGCHYHPTCSKFEHHCGDCPMLAFSSPEDSSFQGFELKKQIYPLLTPTFVTPSAWLAKTARRSALVQEDAICTIQNCVDIEIFTPKDRTQIRKNFGLQPNSFIILFGADWLTSIRKNAQAALDALSILVAKSKASIEVLVFGSGTLPEVPYPVRFLGPVTDESLLADIYSVADIYMHTSLLDNLPNTMCEAQCCGTPVLSFDVGGSAETMIPGKTGFLVQEQTPAALAETLENIISNRELLEPMREAARAFAVERFNPQTVAKSYTTIFEEAPVAQGIGKNTHLYGDLLQNQIASLAALIQNAHKVHLTMQAELTQRISGIEAYPPQFNERISRIDAYQPQFNERISGIEAYPPQFNERISRIDAYQPQFNERISGIEAYLPQFSERLGAQISELHAHIAELNTRNGELGNHIDVLTNKIALVPGAVFRMAQFVRSFPARVKNKIKKTVLALGHAVLSLAPANKSHIVYRYNGLGNRIPVGIDCLQLAAGISGGVESYMEMLVSCIAENKEYAPVLICTAKQYALYKKRFGSSVSYRVQYNSRPVRFVSFVSRLLRGRDIYHLQNGISSFQELEKEGRIKIVHSPVQTFSCDDFTLPSVLNLHDLQHLHLPENFTQGNIDSRNLLYPLAAAKATRIIASSRFVQEDIVAHGYAPVEKVKVIPVTWNPAVPEGVQGFTAESARKLYNLPECFGFYPAQFWPHKNHARLLEALAVVRREMPESNFHIVLTGNRSFDGWQTAQKVIEAHGLEQAVLCLDRIPTEHLAGLYGAATFCVMPSTFEASSYPVIEAQVLGCPVMCSNVTSLPELMHGGAGLLFDPWSPEDIAEKMLSWLQHPEKAQESVAIASAKVQREHSRAAFVAAIKNLYDDVLHSNPA